MEAENKNKPFSSMRRDAQAAAHSLAGLPLIYPSGGREGLYSPVLEGVRGMQGTL